MNYHDAVACLYATQGVGIKLGLENIRRLLDTLNVSLGGTVILHAAGTNGKGSTCAMMASIARAAGYRTGLFTSPHLVTYRERIQIDGAMIPESTVAEGLTRIRERTATWDHPPTFFEITTALAAAWFQEQKAEVIVLETGMGGRLDATNTLPATVSVLTPISFDHQQYLGNTLAAIAAEKAGILKPGIPAVSAPQLPEAAEVIAAAAREVGAPLQWVDRPAPYPVALAGSHQPWNAALAIAALQASQLAIGEEAIARGLREVVWPGRFQRLPLAGHPDGLILDGAHNEAAVAQLLRTWKEIYGDEKPVLLLGILADKDTEVICRQLAQFPARVILTPLQNPRTSQPEALETYFRHLPVQTARSVEEALALAATHAPQRVLATGSLFLVGEALALAHPPDTEPPSLQ